MSKVALRPDSTAGITGSVSGAVDAHMALSDEPADDLTYVSLDDGEYVQLGFEDLVLPAGAPILSIALRARSARAGLANGTCQMQAGLQAALGADGQTLVSWVSPTTSVVRSAVENAAGDSYSDAEIDAAVLTFTAQVSTAVVLHIFEAYLDVTYVEAPTVDVTTPTGTVTDDDMPSVAFTPTLDADGDRQTQYEVKVFASATYSGGGFDPDTSTPTATSGILAGTDTSWDLTAPLADGSYRAYARVAQTVNGEQLWSDWDFEAFTMDVDRPAAPTATYAAENDAGRLRIELAEGVGGAVTTDAFEVERSDDGTTWAPIRVPAGGIVADAGTAIAYDREGANGATCDYRVRAIHDFTEGQSHSAWVAGVAGWVSADWWLKHPTEPDLDMVVVPRSQPSRQRVARQGVMHPLGRTDPVVIDAGRVDWVGELILRLDTGDEQDDLDALLAANVPLLLQAPATASWDDRWLVIGDQDRSRVVDTSTLAHQFDSLPWVEVARPTDDLTSWPSALGYGAAEYGSALYGAVA